MDGRPARALLELIRAPAKQLSERRGIEVVPHLEVRMRRSAGEFVPGAHELTVIAAEDAVADRGAQLRRDCGLVLDGEVGDAAPRIEPERGDDRPGRAGRN